jgi:hypothetical protein
MPRPHRFFPPEYKAEVVEQIRSTGKTVGQVARELDLTEREISLRWLLTSPALETKRIPLLRPVAALAGGGNHSGNQSLASDRTGQHSPDDAPDVNSADAPRRDWLDGSPPTRNRRRPSSGRRSSSARWLLVSR